MVVIELQWYQKLHVPITTNVGSSKCAHVVAYSIQRYVIKFVSDLYSIQRYVIKFVSDLYSIQRYVIKFVSDLRNVGGLFSLVSFKNKTGHISEIYVLLKAVLNTITLTATQSK
jgi:hypothetical protein